MIRIEEGLLADGFITNMQASGYCRSAMLVTYRDGRPVHITCTRPLHHVGNHVAGTDPDGTYHAWWDDNRMTDEPIS